MALRKPQVNFFIDSLAFVFFVFLVITGILLHYLLPPGSGQSTMLGLSRHDWGYLHFLTSIGLFSILSIHLLLHWKWIACMIKGKPQESSGHRAALGIIGMLALLTLSLTILLQPVENKNLNNRINAPSSRDNNTDKPEINYDKTNIISNENKINSWRTNDTTELRLRNIQITGSMTLLEVANLTKIPIDYFVEKLNLKNESDKNENLGRLGKQYGFKVSDVRKLINLWTVQNKK